MKRPAILLFMLGVLVTIFWSSCTHEKSSAVCDTRNMSYEFNIKPILKNNCYICHSSGNTAGSYGVLLDSYDNLINGGWIVPFNADKSFLVGNIEHRPPDANHHYVPMPYMKQKLDTCIINQIAAWINQGALNN